MTPDSTVRFDNSPLGARVAAAYQARCDERDEAQATVERLREALREVEKGYGGLLWALNNAHNAHTQLWKQVANAAELDARAALVAIREALDGTEDCGRLLVGQGTDTWDPLCARPKGHDGLCAPGVDGTGDQ